MLLFVGLGNPGGQYARHRHNIGFMVIDSIAERHAFGPERAQYQALVREGRLGGEKVLLIKPQTFMNESGRSVGEALRYFKCAPEDVVVFHDELDLAPGKLRVKKGGGHAGHNGLRSIHAHIGEAYRRVRLGIGHPGHKSKVSGYVLHDFAKADQDWLDPMREGIARHAPLLASGDDTRFQSNVAQDVQELTPNKAPGAGGKVDKLSVKPAAQADQSKDESSSRSPFEALKRLLGGQGSS